MISLICRREIHISLSKRNLTFDRSNRYNEYMWQSRITGKFIKQYEDLPKHIREQALSAYRKWKDNPEHPSLFFKKVHEERNVFSVRISLDYRALGVLEEGVMIWYWIGSHADYEKQIKRR